jgi:hypothetical protein
MTTTVFRVYSVTEEDFVVGDFVVVVDNENRRTRFYDLTEFQVCDVLKAAQCFPELLPAMTLSTYKRKYRD